MCSSVGAVVLVALCRFILLSCSSCIPCLSLCIVGSTSSHPLGSNIFNTDIIYLLLAKCSELAQGASCSGKGPLYRGTKQLNISETKHFWNMVHIRKNVCFYPLNQYPWWTGPTRPGPTMTLFQRLYLGKYRS